jgi:hypothetical protein
MFGFVRSSKQTHIDTTEHAFFSPSYRNKKNARLHHNFLFNCYQHTSLSTKIELTCGSNIFFRIMYSRCFGFRTLLAIL